MVDNLASIFKIHAIDHHDAITLDNWILQTPLLYFILFLLFNNFSYNSRLQTFLDLRSSSGVFSCSFISNICRSTNKYQKIFVSFHTTNTSCCMDKKLKKLMMCSSSHLLHFSLRFFATTKDKWGDMPDFALYWTETQATFIHTRIFDTIKILRCNCVDYPVDIVYIRLSSFACTCRKKR